MQLVADLHIHTISSGHAYSTVLEIAQAAALKELPLIAITDHGPAMPGAPHAYHFGNLKALPDEIFGVRVLKGIEANIIDREGSLDLPEFRLERLDIVLAGLHTICAPYGTVEENTLMMIQAMKNPWVDVITHPGSPEYPVDYPKIVQAAVEHDVALELNNSSLTVSRQGSRPNCEEIVRLAKHYGAKLIVGSDSHFAPTVGRSDEALEILTRIGFCEEFIVNTSLERVWAHLARKRSLQARI